MLDCQFRIHFLNCLIDGQKRPLCSKEFCRRKSWNGQNLSVVSMVRSFGSVLCEMKMLTREQLDERITFTSYLNVLTNVLNESTLSFSILNTINPLNAVSRDLSRVLPFIVVEIHTVAIDAAKRMQEAFVRVDCGVGGDDRIFFDGCSTVFIGDVSQPYSAAKSGIMCPVEQFRTYMSEEQMSERKRKLEISHESLKMVYFFINGQTNTMKMEKHSFKKR